MNIKTIILVIVMSIIIGATIYWFVFKPKAVAQQPTALHEVPSTVDVLPPASPLPSESPIDHNTDLGAEAAKLTSPDFSDDYKNLKSQVDQSF